METSDFNRDINSESLDECFQKVIELYQPKEIQTIPSKIKDNEVRGYHIFMKIDKN